MYDVDCVTNTAPLKMLCEYRSSAAILYGSTCLRFQAGLPSQKRLVKNRTLNPQSVQFEAERSRFEGYSWTHSTSFLLTHCQYQKHMISIE